MEPDYKLMWDELRCGITRIEQYIEPYHMPEGKSVLESITCEFKQIEQKYQPKQYTWSEILEMNPLPKKIKGIHNVVYNLGLSTDDYSAHKDGCIYTPRIEEMKNLWTIIE